MKAAGSMPRPVWRSGFAACQSSTCRPKAISRCSRPPAATSWLSMAKSTTTPIYARSCPAARPAYGISRTLGHRGHAGRDGTMGHGASRPALCRHVCVCGLGSPGTAPLPGARPHWRKAALYTAGRPRAFCLGRKSRRCGPIPLFAPKSIAMPWPPIPATVMSLLRTRSTRASTSSSRAHS